jgi:hypothetical protein
VRLLDQSLKEDLSRKISQGKRAKTDNDEPGRVFANFFSAPSIYLPSKIDALGWRRNARNEVLAIVDITGIRKKKPR